MAVSLQVVGVVGFYMVAALIMVFVNKMVLNAAPTLTILFMFFQSLTTVFLLNLCALLSPSLIALPSLDLPTARKLTPLLIVDAAGFAFNALCLRDVEAAFYQIARGLVLPLTITVVAVHSRAKPSWKVVGCAVVVTSGFLLGVQRSKDLPARAVPTALGLSYGVLSSLAIAVHAVLIKVSLPHVGGSATKLSYWTNCSSAVLLGSLALVKGEVFAFHGLVTGGAWDWRTFAWGNVVTGVFGFLISLAGILSVKVTSPVTHMFSSAARSVIQVLLGIRLFGDVVTTQRAASVLVILIGTLLYTYVKSTESPAPSVLPTTSTSNMPTSTSNMPRSPLPMATFEKPLLSPSTAASSTWEGKDEDEITLTGDGDDTDGKKRRSGEEHA